MNSNEVISVEETKASKTISMFLRSAPKELILVRESFPFISSLNWKYQLSNLKYFASQLLDEYEITATSNQGKCGKIISNTIYHYFTEIDINIFIRVNKDSKKFNTR